MSQDQTKPLDHSPTSWSDIVACITTLSSEIASLKKELRSNRKLDEILTTKEAALFLRVNPQRMLTFERMGLARAQGIGKGHRYRYRDLIRFSNRFFEGERTPDSHITDNDFKIILQRARRVHPEKKEAAV